MAYYRLYFMRPHTGHIVRFDEYEADNDEAAMLLAREKEGALALELWSLRRKIVRIEPIGADGAVTAAWKRPHPEPSATRLSSSE